jgi:hypothetical protein
MFYGNSLRNWVCLLCLLSCSSVWAGARVLQGDGLVEKIREVQETESAQAYFNEVNAVSSPIPVVVTRAPQSTEAGIWEALKSWWAKWTSGTSPRSH